MSELSILELETESAELLPARETLLIFGNGNFSHNVAVHQTAVASVHGFAFINNAQAINVAIIH